MAIFSVWNLNTSGVGSFKWAIDSANAAGGVPSLIWVHVTGSVAHTYDYEITGQNISIVVDPSYKFQLCNGTKIKIVPPAENILLYNLKVRPGPIAGGATVGTPLLIGDYSGNKVSKIAALNCSLGYNTHEAVGIVYAENVTIQDCILGPGLTTVAQNKCILIDGDSGATRISVLRSVLAGNARVPRMTGGIMQVVNNVITGPVSDWIDLQIHTTILANIENNYAFMGPRWLAVHPPSSYPMVNCDWAEMYSAAERDATRFYRTGNKEQWPDTSTYVDRAVEYKPTAPPTPLELPSPHGMPAITPLTADAALAYVLANAGALDRDALDVELLSQVTTNAYQDWADINQYGIGYPVQ